MKGILPNFRCSMLIVAALFFGVMMGPAACTSSSQVTQQGSSTEPPPEADIDREAIYWANINSARMDYTQADVKFMTGMIAHHAQALVISHLVPERAASPAVQTLAKRIINAQQDEINSMQRWLRRRNEPVPEIEIDGLNLMVNGTPTRGTMMVKNMQGMLSWEQLNELDQASGSQFDQLFLRYMIQHHSGALTMVDTLFNTDGAALENTAFKLASDIRVDQETEIARMRRMLNRLSSSS